MMKMQKVTTLVGCLLFVLTCGGAEPPTTLPGAGQPVRQVNRGGIIYTEPVPQTFDFSFPGGTMAHFVAAVNKAFDAQWKDGKKPNLILPASSSTVEVPPLELRGVDLKSLLEAVGRLLPRGPVWTPVGESTWVLQIVPDRRETRVFYVGHLLTKFKIDDITTALTTVWDMGGDQKPELKYHKDTQLVMVRADKAQLEVAQNVLAQLGDAIAIEPRPDGQVNAPKGARKG
jgi:hypothetical protein